VRRLAELLKEAVLTIPLPEGRFKLETDASRVAIGAILSVKNPASPEYLPVAFGSKKLSDQQRRWPTREVEGWAVVWGIRHFDHYLRGREFDVYTDHESLQFLLAAKEGKLARWAMKLAEHKFTIHYQRGARHHHVDFLSRYVDWTEVDDDDRMYPFCHLLGVPAKAWPTWEEVLAAQRQEPPPSGKGYVQREQVVYYRNGLWAPVKLRRRILGAAHAHPPTGTAALRRRSASWHEPLTGLGYTRT
jgi:hypothetical protein